MNRIPTEFVMHTIRHSVCIDKLKRHLCGAFFQIKKNGIPAAGVLAAVAAYYYLFGCPIKFLSGIPCLGCGMTRAWIQVLLGDFRAAFYFHPLWPCPILFAALYLFLRPKHRRLYNLSIILIAGLFAAAYAIRMMTHSPIVEIRIYDGLIYKVFSCLKAGYK